MTLSLITRLQNFLAAQLTRDPRRALSQLRRFRFYRDYREFLDHILAGKSFPARIAIDLGSSATPNNIFGASQIFGVDLSPGVPGRVVQCDLFCQKLPFSDSEISIVTAFDFLEHVPRVIVDSRGTRFPFIDLMSDIFRVLEPGGLFLQVSPAFPMKEAFQDPTHVNVMTEDTFPRYFCRHNDGAPWGSIYGFSGEFLLLGQGWVGPRLCTLMLKPGSTDC